MGNHGYLTISTADGWVEDEVRRSKNINQRDCIILHISAEMEDGIPDQPSRLRPREISTLSIGEGRRGKYYLHEEYQANQKVE